MTVVSTSGTRRARFWNGRSTRPPATSGGSAPASSTAPRRLDPIVASANQLAFCALHAQRRLDLVERREPPARHELRRAACS